MNTLKRYIYLTLLALVFSPSAYAVHWQAFSFKSNQFTLPYQLYMPNVNSKVPLIIHLHGTGESGTDNYAQLYSGTNIGPDYFTSATIQKIQKAYVLAPQTPFNIRWASTTLAPYEFQSTPITKSMSALLDLIDSLLQQNPNIDPQRIYMTGLSRGGQGVWYAALQRPNFFAAIVPIAGSASPKDAKKLIHLPIWTFHGDADEVTKVEYTQEMVDAIINAGGSTKTIRYTEIQNGQHNSSWKSAFHNEKLYLWMLKHKRNYL